MERCDWDEYFLKIVDVVATRATCDRGRSGCVITKDRNILATGYVGSPSGMPHCDDVGHVFAKYIDEDGNVSTHCVATIHAEQNAIAQAAKNGISINGATLYCSMVPCIVCAKLIVQCGIKRVVAKKDYQRSKETKELFKKIGIELVIINNEVEKY